MSVRPSVRPPIRHDRRLQAINLFLTVSGYWMPIRVRNRVQAPQFSYLRHSPVLSYHLCVHGAASADSSRACSESQVFFSFAILPERHVHVSKKSYIDFGYNFNFGELVFFGQFNCRRVCCRRVGLSASWTVGELVCRRVGLSASWFVGELSIKLQFHY